MKRLRPWLRPGAQRVLAHGVPVPNAMRLAPAAVVGRIAALRASAFLVIFDAPCDDGT
ncbi:MAG: hypothetical protein KA169_12605 [Burkholderiaceae bacterium]|jgi:hypothetical protein|nr:hypothetical protein [Burkholderiaceae bacterium]